MEEWLGFSGQDACKGSSGQRVTKPNKKDFLVTLASWQESLTHRAPMPLKSEKSIVRQSSGLETRRIKTVVQ
ncbi:hypothetical protein [Vibrio gazogenes]|uniref:Uncharacterized protein n=1 Tax=Vibrio gazogenes TaxID=687 RepID=A0A1Z2SKC9_VIBGA|nr:hypothetical protein [Vibrio gazogenes]ASA57632.1 hypothetical protein BSQ33_17945 [Vibrio gazogenes]